MESSVQVRYVLGGVARNVAECASKLGTKPFMISAVGLDMAGEFLPLFCLYYFDSFVALQEACCFQAKLAPVVHRWDCLQKPYLGLQVNQN